MEISRNGTRRSNMGPADFFTGAVRVDPLFATHEPARATAASVTFEPGARSAWHTHPLGQTLIVTAGQGHDFVDPHRRPGGAERQGGRLDGESRRRTVSGLLRS